MIGSFSSQGIGNPRQGYLPSQGMSIGGKSFHTQCNPRQGSMPMPGGSVVSNPNQGLFNTMQGSIPIQVMSFSYENPSMMKNSMKTPYTGHGHPGFYQNPGQQTNLS
jgi:hypothetical protein